MNIPALRFPVTTVFGRFLNDFFDGLPVLDIYRLYSVHAIESTGNTVLILKGGEGRLSLNYRNGKTTSVACEVYSEKARRELFDFVKENMTLFNMEEEFMRGYIYNRQFIFSTYMYEEGYTTNTFLVYKLMDGSSRP